jgi:propanol-preferring alcohol dehydrogenase
MRAARFHGPQDGIVVEDIERPSPGPGEVLVEVEACGICHSDLHFVNGDLPIPTPMTLGHEAAGTVAEVGAGVAGIDTGTSVVVHGGWGCGHCADCTRGETQLCNIMEWQGIGQDGAYAEYVVVPDERYVLPIGDLSPVEAAPLTDAALTPYRAVGRARKHLTPADTVTVVGIGGLGQYAVQFAAMTGAQVVAVDLDKRKLDLAAELGADVTVDAAAERVPAAIREATGGEGTDAIVDFVASEETTGWAANALATRGQVYIVGLGSGSFDVSFNPLVGSETTATACYWGSINDLREVLEIAQRGALDIGVETVGFGGLHDAFDRLQAGEIARRAVLTPEA